MHFLIVFGRPVCSAHQKHQAERADREELLEHFMHPPPLPDLRFEEGIKNEPPGKGQ
jgi:hypothetical protein